MPLTRRERLIFLSPVAVASALALAPEIDGPTVCPFALSTGVACPGCGMTRAASMLVRGDFTSAMTFHPLVPLVALLAIGGWIWFLLRRAGKVPALSTRVLNGLLISTLVALIAVWVGRLISGTLPPV